MKPLFSPAGTCEQSILLWAPGDRREAQEAGEVSLRLLDVLSVLL